MPYPNFHAARIKNPDLFDHIVVLKTLPNGVMVYGGPLKSDPKGPTEAQAYRFPKDKFTVDEAKKWLKDHEVKPILFEPATGKEAMNYFEVKFSDVSVKADSAADYYTVEGYGSTFGNVDMGDDIVEKGAFTDSLLARMPKMLWQHDRYTPIGAWTEARETEKGLYLRGKLPKGCSTSRDAAELAKCGALGGLSIGYSVPKDGFDIIDGIRHLKHIDCHEVSFVTFPMNPQAEISSCKDIEELADMKGVNEYLKKMGLTNSDRTSLVAKIKQISLAESKPEAAAPEGAAPGKEGQPEGAAQVIQPELAAEVKRFRGNLDRK